MALKFCQSDEILPNLVTLLPMASSVLFFAGVLLSFSLSLSLVDDDDDDVDILQLFPRFHFRLASFASTANGESRSRSRDTGRPMARPLDGIKWTPVRQESHSPLRQSKEETSQAKTQLKNFRKFHRTKISIFKT